MKFEDASQNIRARLGVIQLIVFVILALLGARLYVLQVVRGNAYAEKAENQRIRLLPIPAPRGAIFDRNGKLLVGSQSIYNIIVSQEDKKKDYSPLVPPLAKGLAIDADDLHARFDEVKNQPAFQDILIKENATQQDIVWVESHSLEFPEVRVELQPQRVYPANGHLAHVIGYVGEISPEQLLLPKFKDKGYKPGDIVGVEGLEAVYDEYLRGRDGYRKVVVDSRGHIQQEIARVEPQSGQDLVSTIDDDMQTQAEARLQMTPTKRGVIVAMNPNNGEILALASAPTYDPNLFSQRMATKEGRAEYLALLKDPTTPLINRAIQGRYPPGSTWKIPMAVEGLKQGAITIEKSNLLCGGGITIGNKFTRCMGNHGTPELRYAITHSCDAYFYRLGLKMHIEGIMKMVDEFEFNKRSGIDLPHEVVSLTPSPATKAKYNPKDPDWRDIDTVYASFGQVYDIITPISLIRTIASVSVGGAMYTPHLLKEFKPVGPIGEEGQPEYRAARPERPYDHPEAKLIDMPEDQHHMVIEGMWGVVNNGGTAGKIKMPELEIAGKTGTAQVVGLGKDTGANKDHSWFVSFAPAWKPEIAMVALIENVGFGGDFAAPASRAMYDLYYAKTHNLPLPSTDATQAAISPLTKKKSAKPATNPPIVAKSAPAAR
jgi:penicillin-binding protein 2